jgi:glycosyltransferase involved in cell wall biosynthesis
LSPPGPAPRPLITVVLATRNAAATIRRALGSVVEQSCRSVEMVVVDGASSDRTLEAVREVAPAARWVSEPDRGIYDAMNKGVAMAAGEWLYFLGADDRVYSPQTFTRLEERMAEPSLDVIYGNVLLKEGDRSTVYDGPFDWRKLYYKNVCQQANFYRRRVFDRVGPFRLAYPYVADHALNLRVFGDGALRKEFVDEIIAEFRAEGASFTFPDLPFSEDRDRLFRAAFGLRRWLTLKAGERVRHHLGRWRS